MGIYSFTQKSWFLQQELRSLSEIFSPESTPKVATKARVYTHVYILYTHECKALKFLKNIHMFNYFFCPEKLGMASQLVLLFLLQQNITSFNLETASINSKHLRSNFC